MAWETLVAWATVSKKLAALEWSYLPESPNANNQSGVWSENDGMFAICEPTDRSVVAITMPRDGETIDEATRRILAEANRDIARQIAEWVERHRRPLGDRRGIRDDRLECLVQYQILRRSQREIVAARMQEERTPKGNSADSDYLAEKEQVREAIASTAERVFGKGWQCHLRRPGPPGPKKAGGSADSH